MLATTPRSTAARLIRRDHRRRAYSRVKNAATSYLLGYEVVEINLECVASERKEANRAFKVWIVSVGRGGDHVAVHREFEKNSSASFAGAAHGSQIVCSIQVNVGRNRHGS